MTGPVQVLVLDLDGTLIDSAPDLAASVDAALASLGVGPAGIDKARRWIGDGIEVLVRRALTDAGVDVSDTQAIAAAMTVFLDHYETHTLDLGRAYDGVPEILEASTAAGMRCGCVTNKRQDLAEACLRHAGISEFFGVVVGGDRLPKKKPDPAQVLFALDELGATADHALAVGDSYHDFEAAQAAGLSFVFAAYGYGSIADYDGPTISTFSELSAHLTPAQ